MDKHIAVKVENLTKSFKLFQKPSDRIFEVLPFFKRRSSDFLALKNINFKIEKGDFLGVLGRNGAGKSTLLKILSQELTPTSGAVNVNGTVSLLQLGMGFNSELSGRENAIFASKILGYSNKEIEKILPQIIEFAELGSFIDQPIKTYSAGMHSRLSFAVGINVNPDILIADEVLSVGDIRFSQKCLRKMHEFKQLGKTLILVTHDTNAVGVFCNKAIWLMDGQIYEMGEALKVSENYKNYMLYGRLPHQTPETSSPHTEKNLELNNDEKISIDENLYINKSAIPWENLSQAPQITDNRAKITKACTIDPITLKQKRVFFPSDVFYVLFEVEIFTHLNSPYFGYVLYDKNGLAALHSNNNICDKQIAQISPGKNIVCFKISLPNFNHGNFIFSLGVGSDGELINRLHDVLAIEIFNNTDKVQQCGYSLVRDENFTLNEINS